VGKKKQFNQKLDKYVTPGKQIKLVEKKNNTARLNFIAIFP